MTNQMYIEGMNEINFQIDQMVKEQYDSLLDQYETERLRDQQEQEEHFERQANLLRQQGYVIASLKGEEQERLSKPKRQNYHTNNGTGKLALSVEQVKEMKDMVQAGQSFTYCSRFFNVARQVIVRAFEGEGAYGLPPYV